MVKNVKNNRLDIFGGKIVYKILLKLIGLNFVFCVKYFL